MTSNVTLRQLRAFIAVLETRSFSEAAQAMHLSQAALSGLIRELETRLGLRLLDRTTRSVSPTAVGAQFEPMARRVLASLEEALDSLAQLKELRRGVVRIAAPEPLSCTLLPELIAAYGAAHPGVEVRFSDVPIAQVQDGLQNGSVDIGFGPAGVLVDERIAETELTADPVWVALREDDPLAGRTTVAWKELAERPLINFMPNLAVSVLAKVTARHQPRDILAVNRVNTALSMLRVRGGAVVCPSMTAPLVRGFGLAFRPLTGPQVHWQTAVYFPRAVSLSPAAESFFRFITAPAASPDQSRPGA
jgi:DNA-binding transcriptional LysR family regulator